MPFGRAISRFSGCPVRRPCEGLTEQCGRASASVHHDGGVTAPSASPVEAVAPLFEIERVRLLDLLKSLGERDWQRPSPCPGSTVLGLAAYLLGIARRCASSGTATPWPAGYRD